MTAIVIIPKSKSEKDLITRMLKKMNIEIHIIEEPVPNYETKKAMEDVKERQGNETKDSEELFSQLGI
jgi:hypothetical protein